MTIRHTLTGIAATAALAAPLALTVTPAQADTWDGRVCASRYGTAVQYDANGSKGGYAWKTLTKGTCRDDGLDDEYRFPGARSVALIPGLTGTKCHAGDGPFKIGFIGSELRIHVEGFAKPGCKR